MLTALGGVYVVQNNRFIYTQAADGNGLTAQASDWQFQLNPSTVTTTASGQGNFRIKLASLDDPITKGRVVLNYDPDLITLGPVDHKSAFETIHTTPNDGKLMIISEGEFWGEASWVSIDVQLQPGVANADISIDPAISELQLGNDTRLEVSGTVSVQR